MPLIATYHAVPPSSLTRYYRYRIHRLCRPQRIVPAQFFGAVTLQSPRAGQNDTVEPYRCHIGNII